MNTLYRSTGGLLLGALLIWSCGSEKNTPPPAPENTAGSRQSVPGDAGAPNESVGGETAAMGGAAGQPAVGSLGGELPVQAAAGAPSDAPPRCNPSVSWGNAQAVGGLNTPQKDEKLLAMTHDELSVVFSRGPELFVADRAAPESSFETPVPILLPSDYGFTHGLALSPDGLRLVAVSEDQRALAEISRGARGKTFDGKPNTGRFAWVNANLTQSGLLSSPVLASDDRVLILTRIEGPGMSVLEISGNRFDAAEQLYPGGLTAHDGKLKLTQSLSADSRTLFVFDEALGNVVGYWSAGERAAFTQAVPLPGLLAAFTSANCDRLYATVMVDGSLDIVSLSPE